MLRGMYHDDDEGGRGEMREGGVGRGSGQEYVGGWGSRGGEADKVTMEGGTYIYARKRGSQARTNRKRKVRKGHTQKGNSHYPSPSPSLEHHR